MPSASVRLRRISIGTAAFLVAVVGGMVATAASVHVSSATIIPGTVGSTASVTPVAAGSGGKLAKVLVQNGEVVKSGQHLFLLADDGLANQRRSLDDALNALMIKDARITAELAGSATVELPPELVGRAKDPAISGALQLEQQQLRNDNAVLAATIQGIQTQLTLQQSTLRTLTQEQARALEQEQAAAAAAVEQDSPTDGPPGVAGSGYTSQIDSATAQIQQLTAQIDQTRASAQANLLSNSADNRAAIGDAQAKVEQADAQLADLYIEAPVAGTVTDSILSAAGQYLPPAAIAMNLVSQGEGLEISARLPATESPFVNRGDSVLLDLTTGDKLRTTTVRGKISTISANVTTKAKAAAAYTVTIAVQPSDVAAVREKTSLSNGMPVQVHVESGSQSILYYLVSPIAERLRFAFHER